MENNNWSFNSLQQQSTVDTSSVSKTFIASVFSWMGVALAISAVTAYVFGNDMSYLSYLINESTGKLSGLGYLVKSSSSAGQYFCHIDFVCGVCGHVIVARGAVA